MELSLFPEGTDHDQSDLQELRQQRRRRRILQLVCRGDHGQRAQTPLPGPPEETSSGTKDNQGVENHGCSDWTKCDGRSAVEEKFADLIKEVLGSREAVQAVMQGTEYAMVRANTDVWSHFWGSVRRKREGIQIAWWEAIGGVTYNRDLPPVVVPLSMLGRPVLEAAPFSIPAVVLVLRVNLQFQPVRRTPSETGFPGCCGAARHRSGFARIPPFPSHTPAIGTSSRSRIPAGTGR